MNKIVATILLSSDDKYADKNGNMTIRRASFDKNFLSAMISGELLSPAGYRMLPPSMQKLCHVNDIVEPYPVTVPELDALTDILIVVRSSDVIPDGKTFRMDKFELLVKQASLEIWKRR